MSRTGTLGRLFGHAPGPVLEMHPQELQRRQWRDGDLVQVRSRRGSAVLPVQGSESVAPAQAFVAMHWGPEFLGGAGLSGVNALMPSACCPQSLQPELKHAAVRVQRAELPWQLAAAAWLPAGEALALRDGCGAGPGAGLLQLRALRPRTRRPAGSLASTLPRPRRSRRRPGWAWWQTWGWTAPRRCATTTPERPRPARALAEDGSLQGFLLAGETAAASWMLEWLQQQRPAAPWGRALLAAGAKPPQAGPARSVQVCACHDVDEDAIVQALRHCEGGAEDRLSGLQAQLRCGTSCGSCLPAVKALLRRQPAAVAAP